jgi:hypothetical protein
MIDLLYCRLPLQGGLIQVLPNAPITDSWWEIFGWAIYLLGFWVVVGMFLLNICLAIIVDTFGSTPVPSFMSSRNGNHLLTLCCSAS